MWNRRDHNVLNRLSAWGLVDVVDRFRRPGRLADCRCQDEDRCRHVRTRLDGQWPRIPYQTDYLFMASALVERVISCEVLATDEWSPTPTTRRSWRFSSSGARHSTSAASRGRIGSCWKHSQRPTGLSATGPGSEEDAGMAAHSSPRGAGASLQPKNTGDKRSGGLVLHSQRWSLAEATGERVHKRGLAGAEQRFTGERTDVALPAQCIVRLRLSLGLVSLDVGMKGWAYFWPGGHPTIHPSREGRLCRLGV